MHDQTYIRTIYGSPDEKEEYTKKGGKYILDVDGDFLHLHHSLHINDSPPPPRSINPVCLFDDLNVM